MATPSAGRRTVHFETIEDLIQEIDRIVEADRAGQIEVLGTWTPGQILGHLVAWIEYGYEGYPIKPLPWILRRLQCSQRSVGRSRLGSGVRYRHLAVLDGSCLHGTRNGMGDMGC